jgi:Tfp pilus assembly protein PilN
MIKINLSIKDNSVDIANVGGLDFTKVKLKALILVILIWYLPDFFITPMWEEEIQSKNGELALLRTKLNGLRAEVNKAKDYEKQIQDLKVQEQALGQKLVAVKEAISIKKNPAALLLYVAKNTPKGLWISDLSLEDDVLNIKGEALDYSSIGEFVSNLRSSVFVKEANIISTVSEARPEDKLRIERFEVKFAIGRYDK